MKATITDANFPKDSAGAVYHVGVKPGEVANRIVTCGDPVRLRRFASYLDPSPKPFELVSSRGYTTITGRYKVSRTSSSYTLWRAPNVCQSMEINRGELFAHSSSCASSTGSAHQLDRYRHGSRDGRLSRPRSTSSRLGRPGYHSLRFMWLSVCRSPSGVNWSVSSLSRALYVEPC